MTHRDTKHRRKKNATLSWLTYPTKTLILYVELYYVTVSRRGGQCTTIPYLMWGGGGCTSLSADHVWHTAGTAPRVLFIPVSCPLKPRSLACTGCTTTSARRPSPKHIIRSRACTLSQWSPGSKYFQLLIAFLSLYCHQTRGYYSCMSQTYRPPPDRSATITHHQTNLSSTLRANFFT